MNLTSARSTGQSAKRRLQSTLVFSLALLCLAVPAGAEEADFALLRATHAQLSSLPKDGKLSEELSAYITRRKLADVPMLQASLGPVALPVTEIAPIPKPPIKRPIAVAAASGPESSAAVDAINAIAGSQADAKPEIALAYAPSKGSLSDGDAPAAAAPKAKKVSSKELECLATGIYFEARGEPRDGQVAVAQVILNRVADKRYPDTICGVVYQNKQRRNACQFSFACDGHADVIREKKAWQRAQDVAKGVVSGESRIAAIDPATHYHADYVKPRWAPKMARLSQIGQHIFYKG